MHWLFDHAGAVYLILGLAAVGFLFAFRLNHRVVHLGGGAGCLVLIALFWLLSQSILTDRKQIELTVRRLADAVVSRDQSELFHCVSRDFNYQGMDRQTLYDKVAQAVKTHAVKYVHIWDFEVESLSRPERRAKVNFKTRVDSPDGERLLLLRTDFVLEDDVWKMLALKLYNPIVNTDQPLDVPLR
jgi:hypothetical protein